MKRIFSGNRSGASSPKPGGFRSRSNSSNSSPQPPLTSVTSLTSDNEQISPELAPIVTLLSAQAYRRYNEGVFMLLQSINSEGEAIPNRRWREVYGVLLGTQLAIWNIEELEKHQNDTDALMNASSKPDYINFTDSSFRAVTTLEGNQNLKNVIVVSTTLKNQFLLQYSDLEDFHRWNSAFRLATFEYTSLQEAYTGALLSARGSKLSDIRTILAETKFAYEDWVSVRFGSGMPWKRCYAVIEQPTKKSKTKVYKGTVSFYKDEKKHKKGAMAIIKDASAAYALYPSSVKMIDHSTMIKLEGSVYFDSSKKAVPKEASVYFMPEQHSAVPGYDTLIRFLVPLLNTFALYGRPKRLNANKTDLNSLLFGLPVLPHVHYLEVDDLILLSNNSASSNWLVTDWRSNIKEVLGRKLNVGYTGCGSSHGVIGAMNSPALNSQDFLDVKQSNGFTNNNRPASPLSPSFLPQPRFRRDSQISRTSSSNLDSLADANSYVETSPQKNPHRLSEITQIYEDYSGMARDNGSYTTRSVEPPTGQSSKSQSQDSFAKPVLAHSVVRSQESIGRPSISKAQTSQDSFYSTDTGSQRALADPYTSFKQSQPVDLDEDFDDDEIFQKGLSALSVNDKAGRVDPFNPSYDGNDVSSAQLKVQTPSKALPSAPSKAENSSPYTSGRINSPSEPKFSGNFSLPSQASPQPQFGSEKPSIPKSQAQRFPPASELKQELSANPYQQTPAQSSQRIQNPYGSRPQQLAESDYRLAAPQTNQGAPQVPQHQSPQRKAPQSQPQPYPQQQQQPQKQYPPQQAQPQQPYTVQSQGNQPYKQAQPQPRVVQQRPVQQQNYHPQQQGYPPQQSGYVPQQSGYPPQQSGYPPQQQGYPAKTPNGYPPQGQQQQPPRLQPSQQQQRAHGQVPQQFSKPPPQQYPTQGRAPQQGIQYPPQQRPQQGAPPFQQYQAGQNQRPYPTQQPNTYQQPNPYQQSYPYKQPQVNGSALPHQQRLPPPQQPASNGYNLNNPYSQENPYSR